MSSPLSTKPLSFPHLSPCFAPWQSHQSGLTESYSLGQLYLCPEQGIILFRSIGRMPSSLQIFIAIFVIGILLRALAVLTNTHAERLATFVFYVSLPATILVSLDRARPLHRRLGKFRWQLVSSRFRSSSALGNLPACCSFHVTRKEGSY